MDGWVDGRMEAKAGLRIAYSNQKGVTDLRTIFLQAKLNSSFLSCSLYQN